MSFPVINQGCASLTLGDFCVTTQGVQIPKSQQIGEDKKGFRRYLYISDFDHEKKLKYVEDIHSKKIVTTNDLIVVNTGASAGRILKGIDGILSNNLFKVTFDVDVLNKDFLYYFVTSSLFKNHQKVIVKGTANPHMGHENFKSTPFSCPSLSEQKRIVAILDQAFADIDKARAKTEQNLKNARELFESYLKQVFSQRGDGWEVQPLDSFSNIVNGYAFKSGDFSPENKVKSIKITNVGVYEFVEESSNYLPEEYSDKYNRFKAYEGDVVVALTRTIISSGLKVAVVPPSYNGALINQRVAAVHVNEEVMPKEVLQAYLSTKIAIDYVRSNVNELMQPNLSINDLKAFPVPVPPANKKSSVSKQIVEMRKKTDKLVSVYIAKLNALESLKKSILQKAFTGELTNTESKEAAA